MRSRKASVTVVTKHITFPQSLLTDAQCLLQTGGKSRPWLSRILRGTALARIKIQTERAHRVNDKMPVPFLLQPLWLPLLASWSPEIVTFFLCFLSPLPVKISFSEVSWSKEPWNQLASWKADCTPLSEWNLQTLKSTSWSPLPICKRVSHVIVVRIKWDTMCKWLISSPAHFRQVSYHACLLLHKGGNSTTSQRDGVAQWKGMGFRGWLTRVWILVCIPPPLSPCLSYKHTHNPHVPTHNNYKAQTYEVIFRIRVRCPS